MTASTLLRQNKIITANSSQHVNNNEGNWNVSTWAHRAWLTSGCTTVLISLAKSISLTVGCGSLRACLELIVAAFMGYIMADLATGIYHWAIDNYGSSKTPIFGSQIESFQGHHQQPQDITKRQLATLLHILAAAIFALVSPVNILCRDPVVLGFSGVLGGCIMFSLKFHAWAHTPKAKLPPTVMALQDAGIIVARAQHAAHHRPPYNSNYCIVSGIWNKFLDKSKFFVALEMVIFHLLGARPRSWGDPSSDWTDQGT